MRIDVFKGGEALQTKLQEILQKVGENKAVKVGFLEGATYPDKEHTPVALVAAIHNFGAPAAGIPPRPFFSNMVAEKSPEWGDQLGALLTENNYDADDALDLMGKGIKAQLQESIRLTTTPPLKPETVARKGFDTPLIDTNHMMDSVDYEVNK
jgi:hypothetical protein